MSTEWIAASMVGALADSAAGFLLAPGPRAESVGAVSPGLVAERFAPPIPSRWKTRREPCRQPRPKPGSMESKILHMRRNIPAQPDVSAKLNDRGVRGPAPR